MTAPAWDHLELDPERMREVASFFEAYARTALRDLTTVLGQAEGSVTARDSLAGRDLLAGPADLSDAAFIVAADAATALREAGQWWLYLDPLHAARLLARSGDLFLSIGNAFGAYLLVVAGPWANRSRDGFFQQAIGELTGAAKNVDTEILPRLRFQPQQQAYLLLACAGSTQIRNEYRSVLAGFAESSPQRDGVIPVGSLGVPVRRLWSIARELIASNPDEGSLDRIVTTLVALSDRFAETVSLAKANRYLWNNGAAPVDVGDIDLAGIAALTARRFGQTRLREAINDLTDHQRLGPVALAPLEAGLALARIDSDPVKG
jgi:hypothetical protein